MRPCSNAHGAFTLEPGKCQAQQDATAIDVVCCELRFFPLARNYTPVALAFPAMVPWRLSNPPINDRAAVYASRPTDRNVASRAAPIRSFSLLAKMRSSRNSGRWNAEIANVPFAAIPVWPCPFSKKIAARSCLVLERKLLRGYREIRESDVCSDTEAKLRVQ